MWRILVTVLGIAVWFGTLFAQNPGRTNVGEKHYGLVCRKLTTDPDCKACGLDGSHHWRCYSHSLGNDTPKLGTLSPEVAISTNRGDRSNSSNESLCWSSKFDEITDVNMNATLLRDRNFVIAELKRSVQQAGGIDEFLLQFEKQKASFEDAQVQGQSTVDAFGGPHPIHALILFADGGMETARCLAGDVSPALSIAARAKPSGASGSDCNSLALYRDTQLVKDFDLAMAKYNIFNQGMLNQQDYAKETLNLLDEKWWAGQTGAEIAIEVKYYTDLFNDLVGWINPMESKGLHLVQATAVTIDLVKTEEEEGAKKADADGATELVKELAKQNGSFLGLGLDAISHQQKQEGMAAYKAEVQQHVREIEIAVKNYKVKRMQSAARSQAILRLVATIDETCATRSTFSPNPK